MVRVVVLGEFRADRVVLPLRQSGAEVTVLGFAGLASFVGPGVAWGRLPTALDGQALLRLLDVSRADIALPNMGSHGQEQFLPVYARAASRAGEAGCRMPVHSEMFALLASDKVAFHRVAGERGWPVPRGVVCEEAGAVKAAVAELGFPVLVKEARSEFGSGRHFVEDEVRLGRVRAEVTYPVLVQEAVSGEEYAVEFLSGPSATVEWPVASLGRLNSDCDPGRRVRVAPVALPARARGELTATVADMAGTFAPWGPWQIDFAVADDGRLKVIEVNGRLSGVSNMSWASTGCDPHAAYAHAALGRTPRTPRADRVALELPVPNGALLPSAPAGAELLCFPGSPLNPAPCVRGFHRPVLTVPERFKDAARAWLRALPPSTLLNGAADEAVRQWDRGLQALGRGRPAPS
ncbi:ATP-grasp domain-containing protein [Streptomyces sp. SCA3-4]|uniref:ATP-grasp domain-containing protein n=1 Tax=Streptomyces sichuanensis TaxID=2871810 RepID=UPI001CE31AAF|nr:ATP-grasp domain-containing protein [Streptomyces sichuanensis]MCA6091877.1 ATP-grasp domain-containing protein [Streptomyces sichuanensis]